MQKRESTANSQAVPTHTSGSEEVLLFVFIWRAFRPTKLLRRSQIRGQCILYRSAAAQCKKKKGNVLPRRPCRSTCNTRPLQMQTGQRETVYKGTQGHTGRVRKDCYRYPHDEINLVGTCTVFGSRSAIGKQNRIAGKHSPTVQPHTTRGTPGSNSSGRAVRYPAECSAVQCSRARYPARLWQAYGEQHVEMQIGLSTAAMQKNAKRNKSKRTR